MKDLRRWVFYAIVVLSLVLSATTLGLAVLSCFYGEWAEWGGALAPDCHQNTVLIRADMGQSGIFFVRMSFPPTIRAQYMRFNGGQLLGWRFHAPLRLQPRYGSSFRQNHPAFGLFTFAIERIDVNLAKDIGLAIYERGWRVTFPLWWLALFFGIAPAIALLRRRRSMREISGLCTKCGYDLRATPNRCPECGTMSPKKGLSQAEPVSRGRAP
jgi:hypothetical protein